MKALTLQNIITDGKAVAAHKIIKLNIKPFPDSWRTGSLRPFISNSTRVSNYVKMILGSYHTDGVLLPLRSNRIGKSNTICSRPQMFTKQRGEKREDKSQAPEQVQVLHHSHFHL